MMISGMIAALKPTPVPGYSRNHRNASNSASPATTIANAHAHDRSAQRPYPAAIHATPAPMASHAHRPALLEGRQIAQGAEPVEAEESKAEVQPVEAGQKREEPDDRDEDGRIFHSDLPPTMRLGYDSTIIRATVQPLILFG